MYENYFLQELNKKLVLKGDTGMVNRQLLIEVVNIPTRFFHNYYNHFVMTPVQLFGIGYNFSFEKFYYPKDWLVVKYTYKVNNNEVISKTEQIEIINYYLIRNRQDNRKEFFSGAINVYDKNISEAIQSITSTIANDINSVAK